MSNLIPAAPGWYLRSEAAAETIPVIAWVPSSDGDSPTLLPFVPDGRGCSPTLIDLQGMAEQEWEAVYLPNHDPATGGRPNEEQS